MSEKEERKEDDDSTVRVAIRIRPQNGREKIDMCQMCTTVTDEERQVVLGKDKAFTFDYVFDVYTKQDAIYSMCVRDLVEGCFEGYNATVFAYGQTGSGKTYTMGTGFDTSLTTVTEEIGIIPRAVDHLFLGIEERRRLAFENGDPAPDFKVTAQFMELYNEEIIDLMDNTKDPQLKGRKSQNRIHEDANGGIYVVGITTRPVASLDDTLQCLKSGALSRATASTNMNVSSSRSHAIFTLHIRQHRVVKDEIPLEEGKDTDSTQTEFETLTAKFHFVDLAGSERLKRTGATGDRAKEGISINCGLLALGNVISALGDKSKRGSHVPYRDSKLTRLLQDSLGGNSRTLMIACISPSDRDFMETLNTLKYANRARNIRNKVIANQDKASKQLALLRTEIASLQQELMEFKTGRRTIDADGLESVSDMVMENSMLQLENDKLRQRIKALQDTIETLKARNSQILADATIFSVVGSDGQVTNEDVANVIKKYIQEIEDLKTKLAESESLCEHLNKASARSPRSPTSKISLSSMSLMSSFAGGMEGPASPDYMGTSVLHEAKKEMKRMRKLQNSQSQTFNQESDKENIHTSRSGQGDEQVTSQEKSDEERNEQDDGNISDEEDDTDVDDEDSDIDISSETDGGESDNIHEHLANLTCEITIKQKLIEELEQSQKKLNSLRMHYESKVQQLQLRIRETEVERDKVLSEMEKLSHSSVDTTKKVKHEYEKKLSSLQDELRKMQSEQKKHARVQKNNSQYERHLKTLQHELAELKKSKVKLMKQVKEEVDKNKQNEMRRNKELSQMRKEQLKKDNIIKNLERQTVQKDAVLKRKQEEVEALRKRQKPMSAKAAGRVGKYDRPTTVPTVSASLISRRRERAAFSPKLAKQKWDSLEKNIATVITKRQTITMLERDMDVWLKQREKCTKQIEKYERRKQAALQSKQPEEVLHKLSRTIEDLTFKVEHAQENINECQSNIMQIEESKEDGESSIEIISLIEALTSEESKYILEKLYQKTLDRGLSLAHKEAELKELQGRLHQTELNNALQQDLLRHMMDDHVSIEVDDLLTHNDPDDVESTSSSSSSSPAESMIESAISPLAFMAASDAVIRREKARRKTATTQDLLYAVGSEPTTSLVPLLETPDEAKEFVTKAVTSNGKSTSLETRVTSHKTQQFDVGVNGTASTGSTESNLDGTGEKSPVSDYDEKLLMPPSRLALKQRSVIPRSSPIMHRKEFGQLDSSSVLNKLGRNRSNSIGDTSSDATPPASPTTIRRSMIRNSDENVFSRLTNSSPLTSPDRGNIVPSAWNRQASSGKAMLTCTHIAEGHTKSVLSVFATDQLLFTGSKDRSAKTWDLSTGKELSSFVGHPNNVIKVAYSSRTQLVFTISQSSIKIWDIRKSSNPCIKTLSSSGLTTSGSASFSVNRPADSLFRDHQINDIQLSPDGNTLFCGAGNVVQIWDLRRYSQAGRLSGHQAPVMALALDNDREHTLVISGSKDHYIKIFEMIEDAAGILSPKYNLEPPHYDGIQSLALQGHSLFSGSRDMCIKKWDLTNRQLKQSINAAHKDWVCALDFVPGTNILLSGCRAGFLKMWHPDTCACLGEIRAHPSSINAIATNSTAIFTASNECVGIWRPGSTLDIGDTTDVSQDTASVTS